MKYKQIKTIALSTLVAAGYTGGTLHAASKAEERPNIIIFFTDDIDFDEVNVYKNTEFPSHTGMKKRGYYKGKKDRGDYYSDERMLTPHLDQLAKEGLIMDRFYITSPICTPSRYSVLTGRYASRSKSFQKRHKVGKPASVDWSAGLPFSETNIAKELKKNGYSTGIVGKWHLGHNIDKYGKDLRNKKYDAPGVNEQVIERQRLTCEAFKKQGFDYAASIYTGNAPQMKIPRALRHGNLEWVTDGAIKFLDQQKDKKPFFLYMALPAPHAQFYDSFRYGNKKGWWTHDPKATPGGYLDTVSNVIPSRKDVIRRVDAAGISRVNSMATWIDDSLGAVMNKLEEKGIADNTIVIFSSDHQSRGKNTVTESARVPFIIRWPNKIKAGTRNDVVASNIDLAPTLLDIAGAENASKDLVHDGFSMKKMLIKDNTSRVRDSLLLECMYTRGIVTDKWKYIACRAPKAIEDKMRKDAIQAKEQGRRRQVSWDGRKNHKTQTEGVLMDSDRDFPAYFSKDQLYDLKNDPFEQYNLADDPKFAKVLSEMKYKLKNHLKDLHHPFGEFTAK